MSWSIRKAVCYLSIGMLLAAAIVSSVALYRHNFVGRSRLARDDAVADKITRLRGSGRYQEALDLGRVHLRELDQDRGVPPWQKADAVRLVATLEHIVSLPDSCRDALAEADRNDAVIARALIDAEYRKGLVLARKQLDTRQRLLGHDHPDVAVSVTELGELARYQGDWERAEDLQTRALEMRRRVLGEKHPDVALSLELLGKADQLTCRYDEARAHLQESLALRRELFGRTHPAVASSLNSLADLDRRNYRYDQAIPMFREALQMRRKTLGSRHPDVAESLCDLGLTYLLAGDWHKAGPYLRQAVKLSREVPGVSKEILALSLSLEVKVLFEQGRYQEAERGSREVIDLYEALYRQGISGVPPAHDSYPYATLAITQLMQGKGEEAWVSLEHGLNRRLLDEFAASDGNGSSTDSDPDQTSGRPRVCNLETVQAALSDHAALVGWLDSYHAISSVTVYPLWGYIIRHAGPIQWVRIDPPAGVGERAATWKIGVFSNVLRDEARWPFRRPVSGELVQGARSVYEEILAPLEKCLRGIDQLVVVQAMNMSHVPLDALMDSSGTWIGDRFAVSYTPSATLLVRMRKRCGPVKAPGTWRVLAVGDPDFGPGSTKVETASDLAARQSGDPMSSASPERVDPGPRTRVLTRQPGAMDSDSRLPETRDEVRRIAQIFPSCTVLLGRDASKREITRLATSGELEEYDLIHLATHSLMDMPNQMRSAVLLSPTRSALDGADSDASSADDGVLTAADIRSTWKLKADLVTLSACQTDFFTRSQETSLGLTGELLRAGARCLLVSLWDVDDQATALLMGRFYENLAGSYRDVRMGLIGQPMPKAVALQEAKRWLRSYRDADGGQPFANPVFWAAFILLGDSEES